MAQVDPSFVRNAKAEADALKRGVTAAEIEARGGINKSGYWGDSYNPAYSLTDEEYAIASKTDGGVNAALRAKNPAYWAGISGSKSSGSGTTSNSNGEGSDAVANLQSQFNDFLAQQNAANTAANTEKLAKRQSAIAVMTDRLKQYRLESLAPLMLNLAQEDASEDTIMLVLQESPEYKERFKANQTRINKNLAVLTPREYLTLEDTYRQVLRSNGLTQFDNDTYVSQFIGNDMSPNELVSRVDLAVQRVKNSDPETLRALTDYYGVSSTDLYGYMLDPKQQMPALVRKVEAAEIGGAAWRAGFDVKSGGAEELAAQGVTLDRARRGFNDISQMKEFATELPGDTSGALSVQGLIDAEFESNPESVATLRKVRGRRVAEFEAGGEFAASQTGVSGLGTATRGT
jgi:hypothetical protein